MTQTPFQSDPNGTGVADALAMRQAGASVSPTDIATGLQPYNLKASQAKGKTDPQLRQMAVTAVIAWWKRQHADAHASGTVPGTGGTTGQSGGGTASGGGGSSSSGASLPNTAFSPGGKAGPALANIPNPLDAKQATTILAQYGMAGAVPPPYALVNQNELIVWINRAKANAARTAAKAQNVIPVQGTSGTIAVPYGTSNKGSKIL